MATRIKPCGCSDCAGQVNACNCGIACGLICRSKTASANICGFSEFADISNPPKKYRRLTNSGSIVDRTFMHDTNCGGSADDTLTHNYSGAGIVNKDTCVIDCTSITEGTCGPVNGTGFDTVTQTATTSTATGNGCFQNVGGRPSFSRDGVWTNTLTEEDTEDDAEARAIASMPTWTACSGCDCTSWRTDRSGTTTTTFGFQHVQTKCQWTAIIGQSYHVTIRYGRRLLGSSGPFLDLGMTSEVTITADVIAETTDWIDVPNGAGWETAVVSCRVDQI
jgi:hypothetical protein